MNAVNDKGCNSSIFTHAHTGGARDFTSERAEATACEPQGFTHAHTGGARDFTSERAEATACDPQGPWRLDG